MKKRERLGIGMTSQRTRQRLVERLREAGIRDERVLNAIAQVPRHLFVDEALASRAYEDTALPIGFGQTISQPYVVALMTEALMADGNPQRVLEIGTGCGYQTAVLSLLTERVYTVERVQELFRYSRDRLFQLGYRNVQSRYGDGFEGWPDHAPYDGILTTAATAQTPQSLLDQLADGGRLVLPLGQRQQQSLTVLRRLNDAVEQRALAAVKFVPLVTGVN